MARATDFLRPRRKVLLGAFAGGLAGLLIWTGWGEVGISIGFIRVGGQGWLNGLEAPWAIFVVGGAAMGAILAAVTSRLKQRRTAEMEETAQRVGLAYEREPSPTVSEQCSKLFPKCSGLAHSFHGEYRKTTVEVLDLTEVVAHSDDSSLKARRTLVLMPGDGLPEFRLTAKTPANRLASILGIGGLTLGESQLGSNEAETVRRFCRRWYLAPVERWHSHDVESDQQAEEAAILGLFSPRLMESLDRFCGMSVLAKDGQLAVWRAKRHLPAKGRARLIEDAVQLRETLLDAHKHAPAAPELAVTSGEAARRGQRTRAVQVCGIAGLFLGFIGGSVANFAIVVQSRRDLPSGVAAILFPLLVFGGAATGGLFGALMGRALSRFFKVPKPRPRGAASSPANPPPWPIAGMFLGFIVGGILAMGVCMLLTTTFEHISPWIVFPIFFSGPIGGAIIGCWLGFRIDRTRRRT
jgi:hypothetical protein